MSNLKDHLTKLAYRQQTTSGYSYNPYAGSGYGDPYRSPYGGMSYNSSVTDLDPTLEEITQGQNRWSGMDHRGRYDTVSPDIVGSHTVGGALLGGLGGGTLGALGGSLVHSPGVGAAIGGTLGAIGGGYLGHGGGKAEAHRTANNPHVPDEYAYELAREHLKRSIAEQMAQKSAPDAHILPVGEPVSVSEASKSASVAASPAISNIVSRVRQAGLHKVAAHMHAVPEFTLQTAAQLLGTKLAEHNARFAKISEGLNAYAEVASDR